MNTAEILTVINTAASVTMAAGVLIAAIQLWLTKRQALTDFEDTLAREYRSIATELPRPRDSITTRELPRFLELRHQLLAMLLGRAHA